MGGGQREPCVAYDIAENIIGRQDENGGNGIGSQEELQYTLNATGVHGVAYGFEPGIAKREGEPNRFVEEMTPTMRSEMGDNQLAVAMACDTYNGTIQGNVTTTMTADMAGPTHSGPKVIQQMAVASIVAPTLTASNDPSRSPQSTEVTNQVYSVYQSCMAVRRLTPKECERLQGFPDDYTKIPYRNKDSEKCPDGPRYKALGNSWAVPVVRWIGERIAKGEE